MKNVLLLLMVALTAQWSNAQAVVTKADLVGDWQPVAVEMSLGEGRIQYYASSDSMAVSGRFPESLRAAEDSLQMIELVKMMFEDMSKARMSFSANNTYTDINSSGEKFPGTYILNEKTGRLKIVLGQTKESTVSKKGSLLCLESEIRKGVTAKTWIKKR